MSISQARAIRAMGLPAVCLFVLSCLGLSLHAQTYTLSGTVRDTATHAVPNATVTAKSMATGKTYRAQTNSDGGYTIDHLDLGDYEVSAVAGELQAPAIKVTITAA